MTLTLPTPDAGDTARQRFALELLLQQPVPGPEQLLASRNLLSDALPDVAILVFLGIHLSDPDVRGDLRRSGRRAAGLHQAAR